MHTHDHTATAAPAQTQAPARPRTFRWLQWLTLLWPRDNLRGLDDRTRRDIGLPHRHTPPDAATLLDMSRPGGRRW